MKLVLTFSIIIILVSCEKTNPNEYKEIKPSPIVDARVQSWKKLHDVSDFDWLKDNVLIRGMPQGKLIEYLGDPTEVTEEENSNGDNYLWCYRNPDPNQRNSYARYFGVDRNGKLTWIGSNEYDPHPNSGAAGR